MATTRIRVRAVEPRPTGVFIVSGTKRGDEAGWFWCSTFDAKRASLCQRAMELDRDADITWEQQDRGWLPKIVAVDMVAA
jgi:hypothetical protein